MEDFAVWTRRDPERFAARFAAVASHPGPLTALGLGANRHGGKIDIHPQPRVMEAVAGCDAIAFEIVPGHLFKLCNMLRGTGPQGPRHGRLLGTARPPKGPLHGTISPTGNIILRDGLGAAADPAQDIEQFVDGAIADRFLRYLHLFPQRSKETVSP